MNKRPLEIYSFDEGSPTGRKHEHSQVFRNFIRTKKSKLTTDNNKSITDNFVV